MTLYSPLWAHISSNLLKITLPISSNLFNLVEEIRCEISTLKKWVGEIIAVKAVSSSAK
jgi:hypothetical protein